jgi:hypothetical protein
VVLLLLKNVSDAFSRRGVGGKKENQKKKRKKETPSTHVSSSLIREGSFAR